MSHTWILDATIVTQDARRNVLQGHIEIKDGRIARIARSRPSRIPRGAKVIDAAGLTIVPGFVQAHIHLCQTLFRNMADDLELLDWLSKRIWVFEAAHTAETLRTSALLGIHELLSSGTTCILDMGTVRHTDAIAGAVRDSGIRANIGKCLMDHPKTTPPTLRENTQVALAEASALFDKWNGAENDRIRVSYAPRFVISCTEELLTEVARRAERDHAIVHTHASENLKEIQLVKRMVHCENVEYLDQLGLTSERLVLAHCIWLKPNEKNILRRTGTNVVHCPGSNLKLASGIAHVPDLMKRKINVALGADGAPCNNNLDAFNEMRLAALIHKPGAGPRSMNAQEALDMATRNGARALGWFDDIGSIEVGKKADLVALDLRQPHNVFPDAWKHSPQGISASIVYSSSPRDVRWTLVDGKMVFNGKRVTTIDEKKLIASARAAQKLIGRRVRSKKLPKF